MAPQRVFIHSTQFLNAHSVLGNICGLGNTVVDEVDKIYPFVRTQHGIEVLAGETVAMAEPLLVLGPMQS